MNVKVTLNGNDITNRVVSYERIQKVCSGIGELTLELEGSFSGSVDPWDEIIIEEGGEQKGIYYVNSVNKTHPAYTYTISAQDGSKRLVDYFIADNYIITYASNSVYWIKKFLTEAGVDYDFDVPEIGSLLSNNTSLGLQNAHEQITQLLQMNGWFMYFDENGVCRIGKLSTDLGNIQETFTKNDITEIQIYESDKQLRNRAVVWGNGNPTTGEWAFASISRNVPWMTSDKDYRAAVLSNSSIPDSSVAYSLATLMINEFSRLSIEKEVTVHGARNVKLGTSVFVDSNVFSGVGIVTTVGATVSKNGFFTKVILDERCPRLFGYFDFGDYVYIGTERDGVWRKHIKYDHNWYNYSTGLTDLGITDLNVSNGILNCVTKSGESFFSTAYRNFWTKMSIPALTTYSGSFTIPDDEKIEIIINSGIKARNSVIDYINNEILVTADTTPFENSFYYAPFVVSGYVPGTENEIFSMSGIRSWLLKYNKNGYFNKAIPIYEPSNEWTIEEGLEGSFYKNYDVAVRDIEYDGQNTYISVAYRVEKKGLEGFWIPDIGSNYGKFSTSRMRTIFTITSMHNVYYNDKFSDFDFNLNNGVVSTTFKSQDGGYLQNIVSIAFMEETWNASQFAALVDLSTAPKLKVGRVSVQKVGNEYIPSFTIKNFSITLPDTYFGFLYSKFISEDTVRIFYYKSGGNYIYDLKKFDITFNWNSNTASVSSGVYILSFPNLINMSVSYGNSLTWITINNNIYSGYYYVYDDEQTYEIGSYTVPNGYYDVVYSAVYRNFIVSSKKYDYQSMTLFTEVAYGSSYVINKQRSLENIELITTTFFKPIVNYYAGFSNEYYDYYTNFLGGFHILFKENSYIETNYITSGIKESTKAFLSVQTQNAALLYDTSDGKYYSWDFFNIPIVIENIGNISFTPSIIFSNKTYEGNLYAYGTTPNGNAFVEFDLKTLSIIRYKYIDIPFASGRQVSKFPYTYNVGSFYFYSFYDTNTLEYLHQILFFTRSTEFDYKNVKTKYAVLKVNENDEITKVTDSTAFTRFDISNSYPVLAAYSGVETLYIIDNMNNDGIIAGNAGSLSGKYLGDFHYTFGHTVTSGLDENNIVVSGISQEKVTVFTAENKLYAVPIFENYGFNPANLKEVFVVQSGVLNALETTNFANPYQYIFVATSGENPTFYQKDSTSADAFIIRNNNLPSSPITTIRIDDRV